VSADTRTRIIEAAHERVAADGVARTTIESVAQHAGLSRATIYRYFPGGRDELAAAVARPVAVGDQEVVVRASVGVSVWPEDGADFPALLHSADMRMYATRG